MDTHILILLCLTAALCLVHVMSDNCSGQEDKLRVSAWNCRGIKGSIPYIRTLMEKSDVVALSEHKLYDPELRILDDISSEFVAYGRCSEDLQMNRYGFVPGHCGVALLWRKTLASQIKPLPKLGTDRICVVKVCMPGHTLDNVYIISVYLPQSQCVISSYQHHIDALQSALDVCSADGRVLVLGDWNAHFGENFGGRAWGKTSANGKKAARLIKDNDLCIVDLKCCDGPVYTYCGENGGMSYIDHCVVSSQLADRCVNCKVLGDEPENTSDHLPLCVEVLLKHCVYNPKPTVARTSWEKVLKQGAEQVYTNLLENRLHVYFDNGYPQSPPSDWSVHDIDAVYNELVSCIKHVDAHLPKSKFKKAYKPCWTERLSQLVKEKKSAWKAWSDHGKPRDPLNPLWQAYKESKRSLRRELRWHSNQQDSKFAQEVVNADGMDQDYFWSLINRRRSKKNTLVHPFQKTDGSVLTDMKDIRTAWGVYYKDLYTPKDTGYNQAFKEQVDSVMDGVDLKPQDNSVILHVPITKQEVEKVIKKLKNKKAAGPDGIQAEHVKMGGASVVHLLTDLCNAMVAREHRPSSMKRGFIVPIPKGRKDSSLPDNNRGITLISVICKIYDSILVTRSNDWFQEVLDDLQGAKHKHCSSIHTSLILREAIAYCTERGNTVYTALLDVKKAFDQVWINGLFYKLKQMNMDPKLWRILLDAYNDFQCCVVIGGETSQYFSPKQGIHQGDVWSMPLYCVYNNDLIKELKASLYCTYILSNVNCTVPTFVDDLAIIALSKTALNQLLGMALRYSRKWRFQYGADKSFVLAFGKDTTPKLKIVLGNSEIKVVDNHTHVGVPLCSSKSSEKRAIDDRVSVSRQTFFIIKALTPPPVLLNPIVASKLYWSLCVTKLTYGLEVWPPGEQGLTKFETFHNQVAKTIQGLPDKTSDPMCHAALNWRTMESHYDVLTLMFLWRLMSLPATCIYNQLFIKRITNVSSQVSSGVSYLKSPIHSMYHIADKYGMTQFVLDMLESGLICSKSKWQSTVEAAVKGMQTAKWHMLCMMYKRVNLVYFPEPARLQWWFACKERPGLVKKCRILISLLAGELNLGCGKGRHIRRSSLCQLCEHYVEETISHFLLECSGLQEARGTLLKELFAVMPPGMVHSLSSMTHSKQAEFLLCTMGRTHVAEWEAILVKVIDLVYGLYRARDDMLELLAV